MLCDQIGANIKRLRREKGMTQSQLADRLCVSHQMISKYESGTTLPDIVTLVTLCKLLDTSLDGLCGLEESSKEVLIRTLTEQYAAPEGASFSSLEQLYQDLLRDGEPVLSDDRVMMLRLRLLEQMHDTAENNRQHRAVNERIVSCASHVLDTSRDDELRSYANYLLAIYYCETPFDSPDYEKNLALSRDHAKKVLLCTYFPKYTPSIGWDPRSEEYRRLQEQNLKFYAQGLERALRRSAQDPISSLDADPREQLLPLLSQLS
ncbi:MAG: helix-turn-helix transcriptional regulator [Clostridia bacterium]|nr:helix-turn-helix transcriptional regulator [Clostridia bacterium]